MKWWGKEIQGVLKEKGFSEAEEVAWGGRGARNHPSQTYQGKSFRFLSSTLVPCKQGPHIYLQYQVRFGPKGEKQLPLKVSGD